MQRLDSDVAAVLDRIAIDTGGGCSVFKAQLIASLIARNDLKATLDIGVYRGRSLFPQAVAHRNFTGGVVYGVDPWDMVAAGQADIPAEVRDLVHQWERDTDLQKIYESVNELRNAQGFEKHVELVRMTSASAIKQFEAQHVFFDLIHIDGNHDRERVTNDVELYLPRLRRNGFLVLDDISWDSIKDVYVELKHKMCHLFERIDAVNDFAVYWNGRSWPHAQAARLQILDGLMTEKLAWAKAGLARRGIRVGRGRRP